MSATTTATACRRNSRLTPENAAELIRRGKERFGIYCAVCHGTSGDGNGITANYGVPVAANPNAKLNAISPRKPIRTAACSKPSPTARA